jgi:hypothetical protein
MKINISTNFWKRNKSELIDKISQLFFFNSVVIGGLFLYVVFRYGDWFLCIMLLILLVIYLVMHLSSEKWIKEKF